MFDWTMYSKLTCLQINFDTILFSDRQFDSLFDTTHTVIGVTHDNAQLPHSSITKPFQPPEGIFAQNTQVKRPFRKS